MTHTPRNARPTTRRSGKGLTTLAAALLLALTLGACGDGGSEMTATKKDRTESSSTPSPRDSEPTDEATDEPTEVPTAVPTEEPSEDADQQRALTQLVEETQGFVAQQLEDNRDTYSAMTVTGSGDDTIVYSYTYAKKANPDSTAKAIEAQSGSLQSTLDGQVFPAMRQVGIASPRATYIYKNVDGSVIWEKNFSPS